MLFHCGYERFEGCMCDRALNDKRVIWNFIESSPWHGHVASRWQKFRLKLFTFWPNWVFPMTNKKAEFSQLAKIYFFFETGAFCFFVFLPSFCESLKNWVEVEILCEKGAASNLRSKRSLNSFKSTSSKESSSSKSEY
jgi:hypothetical protein